MTAVAGGLYLTHVQYPAGTGYSRTRNRFRPGDL